jgi:hypothetical protein
MADRIDRIPIRFPWGTDQVPETAWLGYQDGKVLTWFSTQGQADIALRRRKIDAASPLTQPGTLYWITCCNPDIPIPVVRADRFKPAKCQTCGSVFAATDREEIRP